MHAGVPSLARPRSARLSFTVRQHVERVSKFLLGFEALVLIYPTLLGLVLAAGSLAPVVTGSWTIDHFVDVAAGAATLLGLICGWRLALSFLVKGREKTRALGRPWWAAASAFAFASALIWALSWHSTHSFLTLDSPFSILGYGVLFVPSFIHLSAEVWLRAV